jgi:exodeoxyribonuclease VII large subunit
MSTSIEIQTTALTVSNYAGLISQAVRQVGAATIEGEIQSAETRANGMVFFSITDGESKLDCKVFRGSAVRLSHVPTKGDLVRIDVERPDYWIEGGRVSVIVTDVRLAGAGELLARRQALLTRLQGEGLCDSDRWRPVPRFPRTVGVISAAGSKGMGDVVAALIKRFPPVWIKTCAATVQGVYAVGEIIDALGRLQAEPEVDVIIIARGGGSIFDMIAFDDERLCRAIWACSKPVIVGIGHTDDDNVVNHVTWAAETPSKTPEQAVPSAAELIGDLSLARQSIGALPGRIDRVSEQIAHQAERIDVGQCLDALLADVESARFSLSMDQQQFFAERQKGIAGARATIGLLPSLMPDPATIAVETERIDARARALLASREQALDHERRRLADSADRLAGIRDDIAEQSRRISVGIRRVAAAHELNYGQAIERRVREVAAAAKARLASEAKEIADATTEIRRRADQRLLDAQRDLRVLTSQIDSHDFIKHGYVLAADEDGQPVRSAQALATGQHLQLQFADGRARTTVDTIEHLGESS